jgi:T1SS-143 domain-containing protein
VATEIGMIKTLIGTAVATASDGSQRTLQAGDRVFQDEVITTGAAGAVEIEFSDGSVMTLGRSSQAVLDLDTFNPQAVAEAPADVEGEVDALQQALLEGADPSQIGEATAAGAGAGPGGNEGTDVVQVIYEAPEVTPESGFETTGITLEFDEEREEIPFDDTPTAGITTVLLDEDDLYNFAGGKGEEGHAELRAAFDAIKSDFETAEELSAHPHKANGPGLNDEQEGDDLPPDAKVFVSSLLNVDFGADGPGDIVFNAEGTQPAGLTSGGEDIQYWVSADGHSLVAYIDFEHGRGRGPQGEDSGEDGGQESHAHIIFTAEITDVTTGEFQVMLLGPVDHPDGTTEDNLFVNLGFTISDLDGDTAAGVLRLDIDDDSPVIVEDHYKGGEGNDRGEDSPPPPGEGEDLTVDEDDIDGRGNQDNAPGDDYSNTYQDLSFNFGADGPAADDPVALSPEGIVDQNGDALTSNGVELQYTWDGDSDTLIGYTDDVNSPVLTISVDYVEQTGAGISVNLLDNIDHPQNSYEDNLEFNVTYTVTDFDGDSVSSTFAVDIDDDMPTIVPQRGSVDEEGLPTGNAGDSYNTETVTGGVLVIPELERNSNLHSDLSSEAKDTIRSFVDGGGNMVVSYHIGLINDVFGFSLSTSGAGTYNQTPGTSGTPFASGPPSVGDPSATHGLNIGSLPAGSEVMYATGSAAAVVVIPVGAGQITFIGWDWFNAAPLGSTDGGWLEVLDIAITQDGVGGNDVTVFDNGSYVDTDGGYDSESDTIQATLNGLGHNVTTFTGITAADFAAALQVTIGDLPGEDLTAHGSLGIGWGADDRDVDGTDAANPEYDRSVSFDEQLAPEGLTSNGVAIVYTVSEDGLTLTATAGETVVFTVVISDEDTGTYDFTLLDNLDHPEGATTGEDASPGTEDDINLSFDFTATDSDGDAVGSHFTITVDDDAPVIGNGEDSPAPEDSTVDEEGLATAATQDDGYAGDVAGIALTAAGDLNISWGADDANAINYTENFEDGATGWTNNATTDGGPELTNFLGRFAGSEPIVSKTYDFGTENAGRTVTLEFDMYEIDSWDSETFTVLINGSPVSVDTYEWNDGRGNLTDGGTPTSGNVFTGFGAEEAHHYSLEVTLDANGQVVLGFDSSLNSSVSDESWGIDNISITAGTGMDRTVEFDADQPGLAGLTSNGVAVTFELSDDDTVLTAKAGDATVFTVSLSDLENGSYDFSLLDNLDHPEANTEDDINLEFAFTATDSDGDTASSSFTVTVDDDAPVFVSGTEDTLIVDEDGLGGANIDASRTGEVTGTNSDTTTGNLADNFSSGADEGTSIFSVNGVEAVEGTITVETAQYRIEVEASSGDYTFTLLDNVLEAGAGENNQSLPPIALTVVAEDGDGDQISGGITLNVSVLDDIPVIDVAEAVDAQIPTLTTQDAETVDSVIADGFATINLQGDDSNSDTYELGIENAGKSVTIDFDAATIGTWDETGGAQDDFIVTVNGVQQILTHEAGATHYTLNAIANGTGQVTIAFATDVTASSEGVDVSNLSFATNSDVDSGSFAGLFTLTSNMGADEGGVAPSLSYALSVTDADSGLSSDGEAITLAMNNGVIEGSTSAGVVFAISVDAATGEVTSTQYEVIDHVGEADDSNAFNNSVNNLVLDAGTIALTASATITDGDGDSATDSQAIDISGAISFDDDIPGQPADINKTVQEAGGSNDTNLMIVLDVSGSMDDAPGIPGFATRLAVAKDAIDQLISTYDDKGDVMVRIVTFHDHAHTIEGTWMTATAASDYITALSDYAGNDSTNYDAALADAQTAFASSGKIVGAENVSYFLSDGEPTSGSGESGPGSSGGDGIGATEQSNWETFLNNNNITSHALGLGTGVSATALEPIAYDGDAVIVDDLADLAAILAATVASPELEGNLVTEGLLSGDFGADGPAALQIVAFTHDGTTYTTASTEYDSGTKSLTIETAADGAITVNFETGAYSYESPGNVDVDTPEVFVYTIEDGDGDQQNGNLTIVVEDSVPVAYDNANQAMVWDVTVPGPTPPPTTTVLANFSGGDSTPSGGPYNPWIFDTSGGTQSVIDMGSSLSWDEVGSNFDKWYSTTISGSTFDAGRWTSGPGAPLYLEDNNDDGSGSARLLTPVFTTDADGSTVLSFDYGRYNTRSNDDGEWKLFEQNGSSWSQVQIGSLSNSSTSGAAASRTITTGPLDAGKNYRLSVEIEDGSGSSDSGVTLDNIRLTKTTAGTPTTNTLVAAVLGNVLTDANTHIPSNDPWGGVDSEGVDGAALMVWDGGSFIDPTVSGTTIVGAYGSLTINSDGSYEYTPDADITNLGEQDVFTYQLAQADGDTDDAQLVITIGGTPYVEPVPEVGSNVTGTSDDDVILGTAGNDTLDGGEGDDHIEGGAGSDTIIGGKGDDVLFGGDDADTFVWNSGDEGTSGSPAHDTVVDFDATDGDELDLSDLLSGLTSQSIEGIDNGSGDLQVNIKEGANVVQEIELLGVATGGDAAATLQSLLDSGAIIDS